MHWRNSLRYLLILAFLYVFHDLGLSIPTLTVLGAMLLAFVALRGTIYGTVSRALEEHVPHTRKLPNWLKYAVTFAVFLLIFVVLKELVYLALYYVGVDVKGEMFEAMNRSMNGD